MTAAEIKASLEARGFPPDHPAAFAVMYEHAEKLERALRDLLERVDRAGGLGAYEGGPPFAVARARKLLGVNTSETKA